MKKWFLTSAMAAAVLAGCGGTPSPGAAEPVREEAPRTALMTCQSGWSWGDKPQRGAHDVAAGPIRLLGLRRYAGPTLRRGRAIYAKVLLRPHATTTVAVAPEHRDRVRLDPNPPNDPSAVAGGRAAIRFEGCAPRVDDSRTGEELGTGYAIAVMVDRPTCATFEIVPEGGETIRRRVRFGVRDCD